MDVITFPENLLTTSGLSILMHGVISLPGATSEQRKLKSFQFLLRLNYNGLWFCYGFTKFGILFVYFFRF